MELLKNKLVSPPVLGSELTLLLLCSRKELTEEERGQIQTLIATPLDWKVLLNLSHFHNITPLLFHNLCHFRHDGIPQEVFEDLKKSASQSNFHNLHLTGTLRKVLRLLSSNNIIAVPFKGPLLSLLAYGDINLRMSSDLDILVSRHDAIRTRDLLLANGYCTYVTIPAKHEKMFLEKENFFALHNAQQQVTIDLHWELTGRYASNPLYLEDLQPIAHKVNMAGYIVPSLTLEDTIVQLCIHSSSHCWKYLEHISSIAELLRSKKDINWQKLGQRCKQLRCRRMVLLGLLLSHTLLSLQLPDEILGEIQKDAQLQIIADSIINKLAGEKLLLDNTKISWRFSTIHIKIRDSFFDQILYTLRLFFVPTVKEWQTWPLPSTLTFLYYFYRPLRLAWEWERRKKE